VESRACERDINLLAENWNGGEAAAVDSHPQDTAAFARRDAIVPTVPAVISVLPLRSSSLSCFNIA
jgi:hypothetical protein